MAPVLGLVLVPLVEQLTGLDLPSWLLGLTGSLTN